MTTIRTANIPVQSGAGNDKVKHGDKVVIARGANDYGALLAGNLVLPQVTSNNKGDSLNVNDAGNVEWVPGYDKNFTPLTLSSGTFRERYRFLVVVVKMTISSTNAETNGDYVDASIVPIIGNMRGSAEVATPEDDITLATLSVSQSTDIYQLKGPATSFRAKYKSTLTINAGANSISIVNEDLGAWSSSLKSSRITNQAYEYYGVR